MMTMMMMQRLLQNNNNNNNGYADETRLNGIRHHSASPFSKPAAVQAAAAAGTVVTAATDIGSGGEPDAPTGNELQQMSPSHRPSTAVVTVQTGTCTTVVAALQTTADTEMDDRLTSDEDDELNVMDEDPVDLTNNRLQENHIAAGTAAASTTAATVVPMMQVDTTSNEYETNGGGDMPCNKGRLAFSVENILDPNKFTKKLIAPAAVLPRWRPRIDFAADSSVTGECILLYY